MPIVVKTSGICCEIFACVLFKWDRRKNRERIAAVVTSSAKSGVPRMRLSPNWWTTMIVWMPQNRKEFRVQRPRMLRPMTSKSIRMSTAPRITGRRCNCVRITEIDHFGLRPMVTSSWNHSRPSISMPTIFLSPFRSPSADPNTFTSTNSPHTVYMPPFRWDCKPMTLWNT
uniref:Uncharacterized protein n=1 Tax=Drosophila melanogaster TaxID=7227 RepID=Q65ZF1_DROME|nr:hypothetical 19.8K protein (hay region) - fruit fly (Drosophila melanogaster) [Drosophila melanogaster]CAA48385.1 unknown [Drosophila melanogaster]